MQVTEGDADGQRDCKRNRERGARERELVECFRREEAGMVADEAHRVDEGVEVGSVRDHHARPFRAHGTTRRRRPISAASQPSASATVSAPAE